MLAIADRDFRASRTQSQTTLEQLWCLRNDRHDLIKRLSQARGCARCIIERVIVKDDMNFVGFLSESLAPARYVGDFVVAVIVIESRGHSFSREIRLRV